MGKRAELTAELDRETRVLVIQRDKKKCIRCGARASSIHEIISRSQWATPKLKECYSMKNRCSLCQDCHHEVQGIKQKNIVLFSILQERHGYNYSDAPFNRYMTNG